MVVLKTWALCSIGVSFFSMMADCTDEHAHLFGSRREALFFAATAFSTKAAIALGSLIAGVSLDLIGFPKEIAKLGANPVIAAETMRDLGIVVGPGAGLLAITCVLFLSRYSLDGARVAQIQTDLAERARSLP
jgi:Na+/melibiose symporter-like transporter